MAQDFERQLAELQAHAAIFNGLRNRACRRRCLWDTCPNYQCHLLHECGRDCKADVIDLARLRQI